MFRRKEDGKERELVSGVFLTTRVYGEKTLMGQFRLVKGAKVPLHAHPHEQIGYLVSGCLRFTVEKEVFDAREGDTWCISGHVSHSAEALEDSIAVEVFSPVREDYLK